VVCTTMTMEVEGEEVERQGRKVFQLTAECKLELLQKEFRPWELKGKGEVEGEHGPSAGNLDRVVEAEEVAKEDDNLLDVAQLEAKGRYVVEKVLLDKNIKRIGESSTSSNGRTTRKRKNSWVLVVDSFTREENPEVFEMVRAFEDQLLAGVQSRARCERRPIGICKTLCESGVLE
jgi:hypothetical protein